jgi:hypothetical protein
MGEHEMSTDYARRINRLSTWELVEELRHLLQDVRAYNAAGHTFMLEVTLREARLCEEELASRQLTIDDV